MIIGIDLGTTAVKAIVTDDAQAILASSSATYPRHDGAIGLAEQDPAVWIAAVEACLHGLHNSLGKAIAGVKAISVVGQMHTLVALDRHDRPLRPAILWNDTRGQDEARMLETSFTDIERLTGAAAMPSFTAAKLLWMRNHERPLFDRIGRILLPKDYVRLWLTGECFTDHTDAAGTQLYNQAERAWNSDILKSIGIDPSQLPPLLQSHDQAGSLRPAIARPFGLGERVQVFAGSADTAAGALGIGCTRAGDRFVTLGTSAIYATITKGYAPAPGNVLHNFCHCVPDHFYRMGAMLNGASSLAWAARLFEETDVSSLLAALEREYAGPSRVMFIPYLSGERTPHNNTNLRGVLLGLDGATNKLDIVQAVIEGVAFSLRNVQDILGGAARTSDPLGFIGGGARSHLWGRILSAVLNAELALYADDDYWPALGAVRIAMAGMRKGFGADQLSKPAVKTLIKPDAALAEAYARRYEIHASARKASLDFEASQNA